MFLEQWRPIFGFEGLYEVSNTGRVRRLDGYVDYPAKNGRKGYVQFHPARELRPGPNGQSGHLRVNLSRNGRSVTKPIHVAVLESFVGPRPEGLEARHLDDDPTNNNLSNLAWGTRLENMLDRVRNGIHSNTRKTHCPRGHEYTPENTAIVNGGRSRSCRACRRERHHEKRALFINKP